MVDLNLVDILITVAAADICKLRTSLMQSGGQFSGICRSVCCTSQLRSCGNCPKSPECPWYTVFGQELSCSPDSLRRHQKPPLPFVFSFQPSPDGSSFLLCRLVVVGSAIHCLDLLLKGFGELLVVREAIIMRIESCDYQHQAFPLANDLGMPYPDNLEVLSVRDILEMHPWNHGLIGIKLLSPLRLMRDARQVREFDFSLFVRSLMRRVSSIVYYYGGGELEADFKKISGQAAMVAVVASCFGYDVLADGVRKLSGISGQGQFRGEFEELMPFLVMGSYLNAGKGSSFGMGQYVLTETL